MICLRVLIPSEGRRNFPRGSWLLLANWSRNPVRRVGGDGQRDSRPGSDGAWRAGRPRPAGRFGLPQGRLARPSSLHRMTSHAVTVLERKLRRKLKLPRVKHRSRGAKKRIGSRCPSVACRTPDLPLLNCVGVLSPHLRKALSRTSKSRNRPAIPERRQQKRSTANPNGWPLASSIPALQPDRRAQRHSLPSQYFVRAAWPAMTPRSGPS